MSYLTDDYWANFAKSLLRDGKPPRDHTDRGGHPSSDRRGPRAAPAQARDPSAPRARPLSDDDVRTIRSLRASGARQADIARAMRTSLASVGNVLMGRSYSRVR